MNWYYAEGDRQVGPVTGEQLKGLVTSGRVADATLVWTEGMPEWKPLSEVKGMLNLAGPAAAAGRESGGAGASGQAICVECGRLFPASEMTAHQGMQVCGNCKPAFFQKVQAGTATAALNYAGFWVRVGAVILDFILLFFVFFALMMILAPGIGEDDELADTFMFLFYGIYIVYYVLFHGRYGATPGKMAVGIKVVMPDGSPITYLRAAGRLLAEVVNSFTFTIGYLIAAFDREKRTLHDFLAGTRVIHK